MANFSCKQCKIFDVKNRKFGWKLFGVKWKIFSVKNGNFLV